MSQSTKERVIQFLLTPVNDVFENTRIRNVLANENIKFIGQILGWSDPFRTANFARVSANIIRDLFAEHGISVFEIKNDIFPFIDAQEMACLNTSEEFEEFEQFLRDNYHRLENRITPLESDVNLDMSGDFAWVVGLLPSATTIALGEEFFQSAQGQRLLKTVGSQLLDDDLHGKVADIAVDQYTLFDQTTFDVDVDSAPVILSADWLKTLIPSHLEEKLCKGFYDTEAGQKFLAVLEQAIVDNQGEISQRAREIFLSELGFTQKPQVQSARGPR